MKMIMTGIFLVLISVSAFAQTHQFYDSIPFTLEDKALFQERHLFKKTITSPDGIIRSSNLYFVKICLGEEKCQNIHPGSVFLSGEGLTVNRDDNTVFSIGEYVLYDQSSAKIIAIAANPFSHEPGGRRRAFDRWVYLEVNGKFEPARLSELSK